MAAIFVLHGPNMNLLGKREPDIYGKTTLQELNDRLVEFGKQRGVEVRTHQSNSEGELITSLHEAMDWASGVVFNPGGYTHTSIALRDAIAGIGIPVVEVHMSNIFSREDFRHVSLTAPSCVGMVAGFGVRSYLVALEALLGCLL